MTEENLTLESGKLWHNIVKRTQAALACGSLQPIATKYEWLEEAGVNFLVRIIDNLVRKDQAKRKQLNNKEFNPFLPYEKELFVSDISATHLCLLNKYNVVDYHILIVTRSFEDQETWLTLADFEAMWLSLAEINGLAFYNGGKEAGASQKHKHLQLIPLPIMEASTPIDTVIAATIWDDAGIGNSPLFPFSHAIAGFDFRQIFTPQEMAEITLKLYDQLLKRVGLSITGNKQTGAYNLLATRQWMMIIPRQQESFKSISINALGFAGALLVRNNEQLQSLKNVGPLTVLQNVVG
jgi:ATP adenylyltransferase